MAHQRALLRAPRQVERDLGRRERLPRLVVQLARDAPALLFHRSVAVHDEPALLGIGLSLAFGPLGAFVAVSGGTEVTAPIILLTLFTFCWISGFDIIYALQDLESDRRNGIHSLPARLGHNGAQWMAGLVHLVAITAAVRLWQMTGGGITSGLALTVMLVAFTAAYHQKIPLPVRFFPISAIAGIAGALIPLLGEFP